MIIEQFPKNLKAITNYAFSDVGSTKFLIHEGVTSISGNAFADCKNLESVTFEGTPNSISGSGIFNNCPKLTKINVPWSEGEVANAPWGATNATIVYNYTEGESEE